MGDEEIAGMVVRMALESGSFTEQLKDINNDLKLVESEFKATGSSAKTFGDSLDGLQANLTRCNDVLALQQKAVEVYGQKVEESRDRVNNLAQKHEELASKINATKNSIREATDTYGANSKEVEDLAAELKNLENRYDNNERSLLKANSTLKTNTATYNNAIGKMKSYENQIKETENAIDKFNIGSQEMDSVNVKSSKSVSEMTIAMGNLAAEIAEKVVEAFGELIQYAFEFTEQMTKFSYQTGFSVESLQQWDAVLQATGGNIDQLAGSLADFQERIYDATQGTGDGAQVFSDLGVEVANLDGSLRNTEDVFNDTILALQNMENETLKNSYATMLLSTGGEELARVLGMTNEELSRLKGSINVLSGDEVKEIQELNEQWKMLKQELSVEFMRVLATYSDEWAESLKMVGEALLGIMEIINSQSEFLKKAKGFADWLPSNVIFRTVSEGLAKVGEMSSKSEEEVESSNKKMQDNIKDTAEISKDAMGEVTESVSESVKGMESSVKKSLGVINTALDEYYDDERMKYKKSLEEQYGDTKKARVKIALLLEDYDKKTDQVKQKDVERYSKLYIGDGEIHGRVEENKTKKALEESNKRISQYRKEQEAIRNTYGGAEVSQYNNSVKSYDTGTQYHLGGLAMVHKDELLDLPRGTKVHTKNQRADMMRESVTNNDNKRSITIQNLNVQSNNVDDLFRQLEDRARLM